VGLRTVSCVHACCVRCCDRVGFACIAMHVTLSGGIVFSSSHIPKDRIFPARCLTGRISYLSLSHPLSCLFIVNDEVSMNRLLTATTLLFCWSRVLQANQGQGTEMNSRCKPSCANFTTTHPTVYPIKKL
jgi:hypothetical protein